MNVAYSMCRVYVLAVVRAETATPRGAEFSDETLSKIRQAQRVMNRTITVFRVSARSWLDSSVDERLPLERVGATRTTEPN